MSEKPKYNMSKVKDNIAAGIAEFIGTFLLCVVGGFTCLQKEIGSEKAMTITGVALAHGLVLGISVWAAAAISGGHFNWAVTLTFAGLKRITIGKTILYLACQLLGSIAAGFFIFYMRGEKYEMANSKTGHPWMNPDYDQTVGFFAEAIGTAFLMYMIMALAVDKQTPRDVFGFGIGMALFVAVLSIGPVTGACLNPMRLLGPFMVAEIFGDVDKSWTNTWIYILGPIFGALLGGFYYEFFMLPEENDDEMEEDADSFDDDEEEGQNLKA